MLLFPPQEAHHPVLSLSFREPQDLATSGPEADLYPEGWRHCEPTNPVPGDHAGPMLGPSLGPGQGLILATDTRSPANSRAVVLALNGGSHMTRSLRPNGPSICTPEGGSGQASCVEVRLCPSVSRDLGALSWEGSQEFG